MLRVVVIALTVAISMVLWAGPASAQVLTPGASIFTFEGQGESTPIGNVYPGSGLSLSASLRSIECLDTARIFAVVDAKTPTHVLRVPCSPILTASFANPQAFVAFWIRSEQPFLNEIVVNGRDAAGTIVITVRLPPDAAWRPVTLQQLALRSITVETIGAIQVDDIAVAQQGPQPDMRIASGPPAFTRDTAATFELQGNWVGTRFQCSLDSVPFADCSPVDALTGRATIPLAGLAERTHTFSARRRLVRQRRPDTGQLQLDGRSHAARHSDRQRSCATDDAGRHAARVLLPAAGRRRLVPVPARRRRERVRVQFALHDRIARSGSSFRPITTVPVRAVVADRAARPHSSSARTPCRRPDQRAPTRGRSAPSPARVRTGGMAELTGMRILLTGASSGVGLAAAERFAREGADLVLLARGASALEEAARLALSHGATAYSVPVDVSDRLATEAAVERALELLGGLDAVVTNAGAVVFGHFLEVEPEDFDRTIDVTFTGAVNVIRAALPALRASCGTIVAVSSMMAQLPLPAFSSYTAAKHALRGFLNTVQVEEREQRTGVRIAMVSPGPIDTPIYGRATSATGRSPAKLFDAYHADEIAKALVRALVKPRNDHIVGGESKLMTALYRTARPLGEIALVFVDRWYRIGGEPAGSPGSLWSANEHARIGDGHPGRRSGDLVALGRNLFRAAHRVTRIAPELVRPVPEQPVRQRAQHPSPSAQSAAA